jgi:Xaa-Pro aminopeptidase
VSDTTTTALVMAGIPSRNYSLYHRLRFQVGDPTAWIQVDSADGSRHSTLLLRDIEMQRARQHARVDSVACPADYTPDDGLSGDRETATAQATAELMRRAGVSRAVSDRSLPLIFAHHIEQAGIELRCDLEMGVLERRAKDEEEIAWLAEAQQATEGSMRMACELIAEADTDDEGGLLQEGEPLSSERVRSTIDIWLLERGYMNPRSIVAGGPQAADCHDMGSGPLRSGQPVIIDIFPQNKKTLYNGDCTRTVVHGQVSEAVRAMHMAVVEANQAGIDAVRPGATGEEVHRATIEVIKRHGYQLGLPGEEDPVEYCAMTHGTGHGVGLDVHEPPLLDFGGPPLVMGDCLTIEPGLYSRAIGGVRVEDMVIVTGDGARNLNQLPGGLDWRP